MNKEELVDQIVNELYKKLQGNSLGLTSKKRAVIIGNHKVDHQERLAQSYEIVPLTQTPSHVDLIIVETLGIDLLSQLALGTAENIESKYVLECLLQGKPVYVLEQGIAYRKYKSTAHRTLYSLYSDYENKIKQYGVRLIHDVVEILTDMRGDYQKVQQVDQIEPEKIYPSEGINLQMKKAILESDLTRAYIQGVTEVVIRKNAIVTPLAQDFIKSHHLRIKRV